MEIYEIMVYHSASCIGGQTLYFADKKRAKEFFYKTLAKNNIFDYLRGDESDEMSATNGTYDIRFKVIPLDDGVEKRTKYDFHSLVYGPLEEYNRKHGINQGVA